MKQIAGAVSLLALLFLFPYFYAEDPYFISRLALALFLYFCLTIPEPQDMNPMSVS